MIRKMETSMTYKKITVIILLVLSNLFSALRIQNEKKNVSVYFNGNGQLITTNELKDNKGSISQSEGCLYFLNGNSISIKISDGALFLRGKLASVDGVPNTNNDIAFLHQDNTVAYYDVIEDKLKISGEHIIQNFDILLPNFTKSYSFRNEGKDTLVSTSYADGMGRVVQTSVKIDAAKSLVTGIYFDQENRVSKTVLPQTSFSFGQYLKMSDDALINSAHTYYVMRDLPDYGSGVNPFSEVIYEPAPTGRKIAAGRPGDNFSLTSDNVTKIWYFSIKCTGDRVEESDLVQDPQNNIENFISVSEDATHLLTVTRDVNGNYFQEVKNAREQIVMTWAHDGESPIITRYEYDERGNKVKDIMPIQNAGIGVCENRYKYDSRNLLKWKVGPDKDTTHLYYNYIGLVDSIVSRNYTTINEYDKLNRVSASYVRVLGGEKVLLSKPYYDHIGAIDNDILSVFGKSEDLEIFKKIVGIVGDGEVKNLRGRAFASVVFNTVDEVVTSEPDFSYKGKPIISITSEDNEGRTNTVYAYYAPVGWKKVVSTFDLQGNTLTSKTYINYKADGSDKPALAVENVYDHMGRICEVRALDTKYKYVTYEYAETGEMTSKTVYGTSNNVIETIHYSYNIHGWTQELKSKNYTQKLNYDGYYDGKISSLSHSYSNGTSLNQSFAYDGVNRLVATTASNGVEEHMKLLTESFSYDENGRIITREKAHKLNDGSLVTNTWNYKYWPGEYGKFNSVGHMLRTVENYHVEKYNYDYDASGNMIYDKSKNMAMTYNYQNMPVKFSFYENDTDLDPKTRDPEAKPKAEVEMVYNGAGERKQKIERLFNDDGTVSVNAKLYDGSFTYKAKGIFPSVEFEELDYQLAYVNTPGGEGRISYEDDNEEFYAYLKDHLGSTRMTIDEFGTPVEADLYTAHGEEISLIEADEETAEKFTGKELDKDGAVEGLSDVTVADGMGLNYFGWRYYDPAVGLWISLDPKEQFWSGYAYSSNPISTIDPDGQFGLLQILWNFGNKHGGEMAIMAEGEAALGWGVDQAMGITYNFDNPSKSGMLFSSNFVIDEKDFYGSNKPAGTEGYRLGDWLDVLGKSWGAGGGIGWAPNGFAGISQSTDINFKLFSITISIDDNSRFAGVVLSGGAGSGGVISTTQTKVIPYKDIPNEIIKPFKEWNETMNKGFNDYYRPRPQP